MIRALWVARGLAAALLLAALPAPVLRAGPAGTSAAERPDATPAAVRAIDDRLSALDKARAIIDTQRAGRAAELRGRVRALYKVARAGSVRLWVDPGERAAVAWRRAAARRILARDLRELHQLEQEQTTTAAADAQWRRERARAAAGVTLPPAASLVRPVPGSILRRFGPYEDPDTGADLIRHGVELRSRAGEPVVAPAAGLLLWTGSLRGLGRCALLRHDDGTLSLLGRLDGVAVADGARVEAGAPVGVAAGRRVYFEVRLDVGPEGLPIDPAPLLPPPR